MGETGEAGGRAKMPMVRKRLTVLVEVDTEAQAAYIYFSGEPGQVRVKRTLPCGR